MRLKNLPLAIPFLLAVAIPLAAQQEDSQADGFVEVQTHAGQVDTDGILSPGELPNPNIDYDKAQRHGERRGDERFDNPENDREATRDMEEDRRYKYDDDNRGRYDWDKDREERRHDEHDRGNSWWHW